MKPLSLIVAVDEQGGFAKGGIIPWSYPEDLKHFQQVTKGAACIMGRKTYHDMYDMVIARKTKGKKSKKPVKIEEILPGRECYVVSRQKNFEGATAVPRLRKAVEITDKRKIFIIGGERIYTEALPFVNHIYMTLVKGEHDCDRFFPIDYVQKHFKITSGKKESDSLLFIEYKRKIQNGRRRR